MDKGLGRRFAPDDRDTMYPIRTLLATVPTPPERAWRYHYDSKYKLDQGQTPMCVEYAWHHYLVDGPLTQGVPPLWDFGDVYHDAQLIDEWPGEDYKGTSVRAGAEVLVNRGYVESYHWAWDVETAVDAIITLGPVVFGINWYNDMFDPDPVTGMVTLTGGLAGGHAIEATGASKTRGIVRFKNSWGNSWGKFGHFYMSFEDVDRLMKEDGEAVIAVELKKGT